MLNQHYSVFTASTTIMHAGILSLVQPAMPSNKPTIGKKRQLLVPQDSNKRRSVQVSCMTTLLCSTDLIHIVTYSAKRSYLIFMLGLG